MKAGFQFALRVWALYALLVLLCLFFVAGADNVTVLTLLNVALLFGFGVLALNEGGYRGEKACTLKASLEKQLKEGRGVNAEQSKQVWNVKNAACMLVIATLPLLLMSLVNVAVMPLYPEYEAALQESFENPQMEESAAEEEEPGVILYGSETVGRTNWVGVVTRLVFMPFVFLTRLVRPAVLKWLYLPLSCYLPLCGFIGYLQGPRLRERKIKDMEKGTRRKRRNLKVNKQPRGPKPPKAEV